MKFFDSRRGSRSVLAKGALTYARQIQETGMTKVHFADRFPRARAVNSILVQMIAKIKFGLSTVVATIGSVGEADRRINAICQLNDTALNDIGVNRQGWRT